MDPQPNNHQQATDELTREQRRKGKIAEKRISRKYKEKTIQSFEFRWWVAISYTISAGLLGYAFSLLSSTPHNLNRQLFSSIAGGLCGLALYSGIAFFVRKYTLEKLKGIEKELAELGDANLIEGLEEQPTFYDKLIQINFKYTDKYYSQTHEQADKSFKLAAFASISSFIILVYGISKVYNGADVNSYLTTIAGVLSSFISAVFFYLYNQTIQKMSSYHEKLVQTQNTNLALKLAQDIKDTAAQAEAMKIIITKLTCDNSTVEAGTVP